MHGVPRERSGVIVRVRGFESQPDAGDRSAAIGTPAVGFPDRCVAVRARQRRRRSHAQVGCSVAGICRDVSNACHLLFAEPFLPERTRGDGRHKLWVMARRGKRAQTFRGAPLALFAGRSATGVGGQAMGGLGGPCGAGPRPSDQCLPGRLISGLFRSASSGKCPSGRSDITIVSDRWVERFRRTCMFV